MSGCYGKYSVFWCSALMRHKVSFPWADLDILAIKTAAIHVFCNIAGMMLVVLGGGMWQKVGTGISLNVLVASGDFKDSWI